MRKCNICSELIHPKRLEILPQVKTCVSCSTMGKKAGVTVIVGQGDHTYNDVVILEPEEYSQYQELEYKLNGRRKDDIFNPNQEEDEEEELKDLEDIDFENVKPLEDLEE